MSSELGWTELRAGRWDAARAAFEDAEPSGGALEGLSWAAWWLDDADTVFSAREQAYRLYRQDGDARGAARMATWLAADELDFRSAAAVSQGWLQRARRLLDGVEPGPEHGWLAFHEGYIVYRRGDRTAARELGVEAAALGRRYEVPDLEMLGLALEGVTLVADARVDEGMRCLDEATATALADEATIPISSAWTCCMLVSACMSVLDVDRAAEWCERIAEFADRYGSRYMLGFCCAEYGAVHLWRGRWLEAESLLQESIEAYAQSRPPYLPGPLAELAELRRRQGRAAEAAALIDRAGATAAAQLCRARLALDAGDALGAVELLERLRGPVAGPGQAGLLELLARALIASGRLDEAALVLGELRALEQRIGTTPLRAATDLTDGLLAAAAGEPERARPLLEDAVGGFERSGAPYESAQARLALAETLRALGRDERSRSEEAVARAALRHLGVERERRDGVTPREREVLALLADGLTNRQIAERLVLSEHTVHRHVTNILRKLGVPSRAAAAAHAARTGL